MKTYLIQAHGGQWDDAWTLPVKIVKTEERAKELVEQYQKEADEHDEKMMWYKENSDEMPEHLNNQWEFDQIDNKNVEWGRWECSEECLACKIESYWPSMDSAYYTYVDVEMEG